MNFDSISQEPLLEVKYFLEQARDKDLRDWNGMTVSTVDEDQRPSSRVVLLKKFTDDGLFFYTNYKSKKGQDISKNNNVSVNFWWRELQVQIRISGSISEASRSESEEYFNSRPKGSRISAIVSKQSEEIESFESFQKKLKKLSIIWMRKILNFQIIAVCTKSCLWRLKFGKKENSGDMKEHFLNQKEKSGLNLTFLLKK